MRYKGCPLHSRVYLAPPQNAMRYGDWRSWKQNCQQHASHQQILDKRILGNRQKACTQGFLLKQLIKMISSEFIHLFSVQCRISVGCLISCVKNSCFAFVFQMLGWNQISSSCFEATLDEILHQGLHCVGFFSDGIWSDSIQMPTTVVGAAFPLLIIMTWDAGGLVMQTFAGPSLCCVLMFDPSLYGQRYGQCVSFGTLASADSQLTRL